jgi:predicted nucleic acid-binding protein
MPMIEEFLNLADVLPLDKSVKKTIEIRRKHRKMKLADAIIAATTIVNVRILLTNNTKDFVNIKGLKLIDSHRL